MNTTIYILGIILAASIAILLIVGLVATAKMWFILVIDYWENSKRYKWVQRKGHLKKLSAAAHALHRWSWTYPETRDMNLVQMEEFYYNKSVNLNPTKEK